MVVFQWFQRINQVLAPDPNYTQETLNVESGSLWQILAPDPNFAPPSSQPEDECPSAADTDDVAHNLSRAHISTPRAEAPSTPSHERVFLSPSYSPSPYRSSNHALSALQSPRGESTSHSDPLLDNRVLSAAKKHAETLGSPEGAIKTEQYLFRLCSSTAEIKPNLVQKFKNSIKCNPGVLSMRCSRMNACPDGYTLFMAAAYANHMVVLEAIWDYAAGNPTVARGISCENLLNDADLQGMTAFHIAAGRGNIEALLFLKTKHAETFGFDAAAPIDLLGRTPLGVALVSREEKAQKNHFAILEHLYQVNDKSIMGSPLPFVERIVSGSNILQAVAGMSEMPGKRGLMEDHIVCQGSQSALLLSVCDGHGDQGRVSHFVAEGLVASLDGHIPSLLEGDDNLWRDTCSALCLEVDADVRSISVQGGSTGLLVAITEKKIVVANVGDCRCILVQFKSDQKAEEYLNGSISSNSNEAAWYDMFSVAALSVDHKPSLPQERDRIGQSGLEIVQEVVHENGQDVVFHKIKTHDGSSRLSCSRSFGDFEFKADDTLSPEAQAVIAIPDVQLHDRCTTDAFVILACDGIWDIMSNDEVAMIVTNRMHGYLSSSDVDTSDYLPKVGDDLLVHCMNTGAVDNLSVVVVALSTVADKLVGSVQTTAKALDFESPGISLK